MEWSYTAGNDTLIGLDFVFFIFFVFFVFFVLFVFFGWSIQS